MVYYSSLSSKVGESSDEKNHVRVLLGSFLRVRLSWQRGAVVGVFAGLRWAGVGGS